MLIRSTSSAQRPDIDATLTFELLAQDHVARGVEADDVEDIFADIVADVREGLPGLLYRHGPLHPLEGVSPAG